MQPNKQENCSYFVHFMAAGGCPEVPFQLVKSQMVKTQQRHDGDRCPVRALLDHRKIMNNYTRTYFCRDLLPTDPVFVEFDDTGSLPAQC